jgi:putative ABC transport system permease protein
VIASIWVGLGALRINPLRTTLSTLGVIIGVAALVAVLALGDGMERFARREIALTTDVQTVLVTPRRVQSLDGRTVALPHPVVFTPTDADSLSARLGNAARVAALASGTVMVSGAGLDRPRAVGVTAMRGGARLPGALAIAAGRWLTVRDETAIAPVAVISHTLAAALDSVAPASAVGDTLRLGERPLVVVGVLSPLVSERRLSLYAPFGATALGDGDVLPSLLVTATRVEDVPRVQATVERWLGDRLTDWRSLVRIDTNAARLAQLQRGMLAFKLFLGAITGISLLVGGIGIMNVLLASVAERTREIGIRRASGARARDVFTELLAESVAVTGVGSALGVALGLLGAFGVTAIIRSQTGADVYAAFTVGTLGVAAAAAVLVGVAFGTYPALRGARLSPIDAIRHE